MAFVPITFDKNDEFFNYVWRKNNELDLALDEIDIPLVAEMYEKELPMVVDSYVTEGFVENDLLLIDIVKDYVKGKYEKNVEPMEELDQGYNERFLNERLNATHGGYGYNDSYDDHGLDEVDSDVMNL